MGMFDNLLNPQEPTIPTGGVAPTVQDPQAKRNAWSQLLDDPNMKSALFRMGLQMMQGQRQGESAIGATARAGMNAMDYYGAKNELDRKKALEDKKIGLDTRNVESQITNREAQTAQTNEELAQSKSKFAEYESAKETRASKARLEVENLERAGKTQDAQLRKAQLELDEVQRYADFIKANPAVASSADLAKLQKPIFEANQTKAQTAASNAAAGNYSASAEQTRGETKRASELAGAMPLWIQALAVDKDAQLYAMANKDIKTQSQIEEDIRNRAHIGMATQFASTGAPKPGHTAMAQSLVDQYARADKAQYPTIEDYVTANYTVSPGESIGLILGEIKRLQGTTAPTVTYVRDKSGKLVPKK